MNPRLFLVTARCAATFTDGCYVAGARCKNGRVIEANCDRILLEASFRSSCKGDTEKSWGSLKIF